MYKIYINNIPLYLQAFDDYHSGDDKNLTAVYINKPVTLLQYIDTLEKTNSLSSIQIFSRDVEKLKRDFFNLFEIIDAGGGLVVNEKDEILVIFRRGHWDLAKGKVDKGETIEDAAVREVMEETGIKDIQREELLSESYHAFKRKDGKRILKRSFWYLMRTHWQETHPQIEEDIEQVLWVNPKEFSTDYHPIFRNINEVVLEYLKRIE